MTVNVAGNFLLGLQPPSAGPKFALHNAMAAHANQTVGVQAIHQKPAREVLDVRSLSDPSRWLWRWNSGGKRVDNGRIVQPSTPFHSALLFQSME